MQFWERAFNRINRRIKQGLPGISQVTPFKISQVQQQKQMHLHLKQNSLFYLISQERTINTRGNTCLHSAAGLMVHPGLARITNMDSSQLSLQDGYCLKKNSYQM